MYKTSSELERVRLSDLRPTQMTVGYRAVEVKRAGWRSLPGKERRRKTFSHFFPAVRGPGKRLYILDGHHAAVALMRDAVEDVAIGLACDLSALSKDEFWSYLDHRAWVHCYDKEGKRQGFEAMPTRFDKLEDDPFRSVAAAVLAQGGFAKPDEPFHEFLWANHFRLRLSGDLDGKGFDKAVKRAMRLAASKESNYLPGWAGKA